MFISCCNFQNPCFLALVSPVAGVGKQTFCPALGQGCDAAPSPGKSQERVGARGMAEAAMQKEIGLRLRLVLNVLVQNRLLPKTPGDNHLNALDNE